MTRRIIDSRLLATPILAFAVHAVVACGRSGENAAATAARADDGAGAARRTLVAMARLEPGGQVVRVAPAEEGVLAVLTVREGEAVKKGQALAYLELYQLRAAELKAAELSLERSRLGVFDVQGQEAEARSSEASLAHSESEAARQKSLVDAGLVAGKSYDDAVLEANRAREEVAKNRAALARIRPSTELSRRQAENELLQARARMERTVVRAPLDGQVLRILARVGERVGPQAVLQMGATHQMGAVAEIHANDIHLVKPGQRATFTSPALSAPLEGSVEQIGALIYRNDVFGEDPTAPENSRVIQVRVRLDDSRAAAGFTNLEGQVRIQLDGAGAR
jgi:HlyD family secretion protein